MHRQMFWENTVIEYAKDNADSKRSIGSSWDRDQSDLQSGEK